METQDKVLEAMKLTPEYKQAEEHARKWMKNIRHFEGWKRFVYLFFGNWALARRLVGGKFELWVHDQGKIEAVIMWHAVVDWTDKISTKADYIVAKEWYFKGTKLNSLEAFCKDRGANYF